MNDDLTESRQAASIPPDHVVVPREPDLTDPNVVHVNMLRGTIAKPSAEQIAHIYAGLVVVPREPTEAMVERALNTVAGHFGGMAVFVGELLGEGINETGVDAAPVEIVRDVLRASISRDPAHD